MTRTKVKCELCGQEVSKSNITKHMRRHQEHPESFEMSIYKLNHEGLECQYCGKVCKNRNSLCNHERLCPSNPNKQLIISNSVIEGFNDKGRIPWNKGLTKDTSTSIKRRTDTLCDRYKSGELVGSFTGKHHTVETKQKMSESHRKLLAERGPDLFKHAGRGIKGHYKGIFCASRFELAFLIYCLDKGKSITRCTKSYCYYYNGEQKLYYPDFIVDGEVIEIKGLHTDKVDYKIAAVNDAPARVLYEDDLLDVFQYIKDVYNKDVYTDIQLLYDEYSNIV